MLVEAVVLVEVVVLFGMVEAVVLLEVVMLVEQVSWLC